MTVAEPTSVTDRDELRKARGAFFTPPKVCEFLSQWAIRFESDRVLEPSCGEASFLLAAANRLRALRRNATAPLLFDSASHFDQLVGVEIHAESARAAGDLLHQAAIGARIDVADFFDLAPAGSFDAVLGNPPFIRYQNFTGEARNRGLRAALAAGVNLSGLASSWAAFVVHASRFLCEQGRLGMVLPAELLSVHYAAPVRRFLLSRFASIRIVLFERLLFEDALEDVVLLMAEGTGGCDNIEAMQVRDAADLPPGDSINVAARHLRNDRWTATLVKPAAWETFSKVAESDAFEPLKSWGTTYLGSVTGDNKFFCLSDSDVSKWSIPSGDLLPISPPGSRHLRDLEFGPRSWQQQRDAGGRCWLLYPDPTRKSPYPQTATYIADGEARNVHHAYKCSVRDPWWRVPLVPTPDLFLTYMDHERPRLITNGARTRHLNSLYGVRLKKGRKLVGARLLPLATLNTVTLLGAEVHGRSYGGGLLKLEPREADRIPVPSLSRVAERQSSLGAIRPHVAKAIERGDIGKALALVDAVLWSTDATSSSVLSSLRDARELLFQRRHNRARGESNGEASNE